MSAPEYLPDIYRQFIHTSRYARWLPEENRRESWVQTVDRYLNFMEDHLDKKFGYEVPGLVHHSVRDGLLDQNIGPSMRALMTAGPALERSNVAGYNCAYLPINDPRCLDEALYILMNGTGVGYSVESRYVSQLPEVPWRLLTGDISSPLVVEDSKEGWATAFRELLTALWSGYVPHWDLSKVRPAGSRLHTFGGRASGPEPLDELFHYTVALFSGANRRQLTTLEVHDLMCKIAEVVVVGGVRRAALISLTDLDDESMATAKSGAWWEIAPHRRLANISAVYDSKPSVGKFLTEWTHLYESGSGERGIFNRRAANKQVARNGRRETDHEWGINPCGEIILRPFEFCNLSTVAVRPEDNLDTLMRKTELATILGTWQSTLTDLDGYLRPIWKHNTEQERLLGVSMTGQFGHPILRFSASEDYDYWDHSSPAWLKKLKENVVEVNALHAKAIGIGPSAAATCVKPEGNTAQLFGTSSGMHPWHAPFFERRVRADKKDPLTRLMIDAGIPFEDDVTDPDNTVVFSFPHAAPSQALTSDELGAVEHLEIWKTYATYWTEHNPSITVQVREHEWLDVAAWVYENFEVISGVTFLPASNHTYKQAPCETITEARYHELAAKMPKEIFWEDLSFYELSDHTTGTQSLACSADGGCEVVDITPV